MNSTIALISLTSLVFLCFIYLLIAKIFGKHERPMEDPALLRALTGILATHQPEPSENVVTIDYFNEPEKVWRALARLESAGIDCFLDEKFRIRLRVKKADADRAAALLAEQEPAAEPGANLLGLVPPVVVEGDAAKLSGEPAPICVLRNESEAVELKTVLETNGITCLVKIINSLDEAARLGPMQIQRGWGVLHVNEADKVRACELIAPYLEPEPPDDRASKKKSSLQLAGSIITVTLTVLLLMGVVAAIAMLIYYAITGFK